MHVATRNQFNTYSHPRYFICFLSTFVQFYIITLLCVQCILQPCVFLFSSVLYVDCTWDKSEITSIKTCFYNNSRKSKVIPIDNVYTICKWCISLMSSVYCSDPGIWPDSMKDTVMNSLLKVTNTLEIIDPWWRHQMETFSALLAFCEEIQRSLLNSPHKGQWRGTLMFLWSAPHPNGWANHPGAGDLRHHPVQYDFTVMWYFYRNCYKHLQHHQDRHYHHRQYCIHHIILDWVFLYDYLLRQCFRRAIAQSGPPQGARFGEWSRQYVMTCH